MWYATPVKGPFTHQRGHDHSLRTRSLRLNTCFLQSYCSIAFWPFKNHGRVQHHHSAKSYSSIQSLLFLLVSFSCNWMHLWLMLLSLHFFSTKATLSRQTVLSTGLMTSSPVLDISLPTINVCWVRKYMGLSCCRWYLWDTSVLSGQIPFNSSRGRRFSFLMGDEGHAPDVLFFSVVPMILCIYKASGLLPTSAMFFHARFPKRLKKHQGWGVECIHMPTTVRKSLAWAAVICRMKWF